MLKRNPSCKKYLHHKCQNYLDHIHFINNSKKRIDQFERLVEFRVLKDINISYQFFNTKYSYVLYTHTKIHLFNL